MSETRALQELLTTVATELDAWSRVSQHLETVCGGLAERTTVTPAEMEALQSLDQMSQHLSQLAQLCGEVGGDVQGAGSIQAAIERLNLSDLKARLSKAEVVVPPAGEAELW